MNLPTLENMYVSEKAEVSYAKFIAKEDMEANYGEKTILQEEFSFPWQYIF